jgi:hypothetical protein
MTEEFVLSINHNGEVRLLTANLILQGYTHKFRVMVDDAEVFFEPDEEGHYRAVKMPWQEERHFVRTDLALLGEIQQQIEAILA